MGPNLKYLAKMTGLTAVLAIFVHVLVSGAVAAYASWYFTNRLPDVQKFAEGPKVPSLVSGLIGLTVPNNGIMAVGSSFTFGYPHDEKFAFPQSLGAYNLGVVGLGLNGVHDWLICAMQQRHLRSRTLIVEIPLINDMNWVPSNIDRARIVGCPNTQYGSFFRFVLANPIGTGWASFLFDHYRQIAPQDAISIAKAPAGYFASRANFQRAKDVLRTNIKTTYDAARLISDDVILFVTPIYLPGLEQASADRAAVTEQFNEAQKFCREAAGDHCLDVASLVTDPRNFFNLTHFNGVGSRALAALIAKHIGEEGTKRR